MGKYNPSEALELSTSPEEYPIWRTVRPLILPRYSHLKHGYLYCIQEGGKFKEWEFSRKQRYVECDSESIVVEDVYGDESSVNLIEGPSLLGMSAKRESISAPRVLSSSAASRVSSNASDKTDKKLHQSASMPVFEEEKGNVGCFDAVFKLIRSLSQQKLEDETRSVSEQNLALASDFKKTASESTLFLVCFHLPVKVAKNIWGRWEATWSESLLAKGDESIAATMSTRWLGTVGLPDDVTDSDREEIRLVLKDMDCTPVFLPKTLIEQHYEGFCKQLMWPLFHNVDILELASAAPGSSAGGSFLWDQGNLKTWWESYQTVNRKVAEAVQPLINEGDVVWVHDYHLMLLPKLLHDFQINEIGRRYINMVFFLHIPFPTSQIFRSFFCSNDLLKGALSADVVGFHAFDHARHFLNATKRLMGLHYHSRKGGLIGVDYDGRMVTVVMSHVGIEPEQVSTALTTKGFRDAKNALHDKIVSKSGKDMSKTIIVGCDVHQTLSGVILKLMAYEKFLQEYPIWRNKVLFIQYALLPGNRPKDEEAASKSATDCVERIKERYGKNCLLYQEFRQISISKEDRLALWSLGDIFVTSAIRDGLNLWPLEYLYVHRSPSRPGLVLASEFAACASMLNGALRINPFNISGTAAVFDQALSMDQMEKEGRRARDLQFISGRPSALWTKQILMDMWSLSGKAGARARGRSMMADGSTFIRGHVPLNQSAFKNAYNATKNRVFFFDYGGTLLPQDGTGKYLKESLVSLWDRALSPDLSEALMKLVEDPNNIVFVVSGLQQDSLGRIFKNMPNIGLGAHNGLSVSWPANLESSSPRESQSSERSEAQSIVSKQGRNWTVFDYGVNWAEVKEVALPILNRVTARTNGSRVIIMDAGISWNFYNADPEWGQKMSKELVTELTQALPAYDVQVISIRSSIDILPKRLHKGTVVKKVLQDTVAMKGMPDFIFCVGDDISDEFMYKSVYAFLASDAENLEKQNKKPTPKMFTCCVESKPSYANFYVENTKRLEDAICGIFREDV